MNDHSAGHAELPRSAYLDHTLRRAYNAAQQRSHRYVTLEHLLLALLDDPDAIELLQAVDADTPIIQSSVATAINNNTALAAPGGVTPAFSYKFDNLFAGAFEHAVRSGRKEIDGAFLLVAVAKHPESDASAILAANGFQAQAGQRALDALLGPSTQTPPPPPSQGEKTARPKQATQRAPREQPPLSAADSRPAPGQQGGKPGSGDRFMEDMLANVRSILDAENRKDWALAPLLNPAATMPAPGSKAPQPRLEPPPRADSGGSGQRAPVPPPNEGPQRAPAPPQNQTPHFAQERAGPAPRIDPQPPRLGPPPRPAIAPAALQQPGANAPAGFSEPRGPSFDLERPAPPQVLEKPQERLQERSQERQRPQERQQERPQAQEKLQEKRRKGPAPKASRAQKDSAGVLATMLENIPRRLRMARGELVEIRLGKEEAGQLFSRPVQHPQGGEPIRAVSVRLYAPEGGFFIETMTRETQWLLKRPEAPGEEAFGSWSWAVVPNETGWRVLAASVSVRDIDANGALTAYQETEQAVKVRVGTNFGRLLGGLIRTLILLGAGAALAAGAWYILGVMGKLPH